MFGPGTTGAAIDAFESRFTSTAVGHFMIAANGREAYPISEAESLAFRALYRRRMRRARLIRRASLFGFIPLLILINTWSDSAPDWARQALQWVHALVLLGLPIFGLAQHSITSRYTQAAIERPLKRRITTRHVPAVTPVATPLGAFAKRLLITAFAIEIGLAVAHALGPRDEYAAHMRVLYGLPVGNESWLAWFTGSLAWWAQLAIFAGVGLLMLDRRGKRAAERAKAAAVAEAAKG